MWRATTTRRLARSIAPTEEIRVNICSIDVKEIEAMARYPGISTNPNHRLVPDKFSAVAIEHSLSRYIDYCTDIVDDNHSFLRSCRKRSTISLIIVFILLCSGPSNELTAEDAP